MSFPTSSCQLYRLKPLYTFPQSLQPYLTPRPVSFLIPRFPSLLLAAVSHTVLQHHQHGTSACSFVVKSLRAHRHTGTRAHRYTGPQAHRHTGPQAHGPTGTRAHRHTGPQAHGSTGTRAHRHTGQQAHGHTGPQAHRATGTRAHSCMCVSESHYTHNQNRLFSQTKFIPKWPVYIQNYNFACCFVWV